MQLSLDAVPFTACALPDLTELNPKRKNRDYILQYGRGFLWAYAQSGSVDFYRGRDRYAELERYANGDNAVKSALKSNEAGQAGGSANARIDFRPLPLLHKPLMSVEGLLKAHSYEATVTAVDPVSRDEKQQYEGRMRAWMAHQEFLQGLGNAQPGGPGADIPVDEDELGLHMELSYQAEAAIALEQKIAFGMYLADYARQDQLCTRDEMVKGPSVLFMARRGPRRLPMHITPGDCFILPAAAENFPNLQAGAHIERLSLAQVLAEIEADPDTTLSDTERETLKGLARTRQQPGSQGGGTYANYGGQVWLTQSLGSEPELAGQVEVIRFAFCSTDLEVQKEYTNVFGNKQVRVMEAGYGGPQEANPGKAKDMKVLRRTVQNWYEGTLVLGCDIGYGCRRAYEQLPDPDNEFACLPLYVVNAPGMLGGKIKSLVERCKIPVDIASRAVVKMQHNEAKWWDMTVKLNQNALQEAAANGSAGGKALTRADIMRELVQENIIVGNDYDEQGNPLGAVLQFFETPLGNAIIRHQQTINWCKAEIADITGINGAISGDDPASRQGEGVTNLAIQGSQNALNHLFVAKHSRFERVARAIAASVKGSEARAPLAGSMVVAGRGGQQRTVYVQPAPELDRREFQFKVEQKPTDQQWADFYGYLKNFTLGPDPILSPTDVADLWGVDNLKLARYLLAVRYKRAQARREQLAQANSESQGKQAQLAAQAAGEQERQTSAQKHQEAMELARLKGGFEVRVAQIQASGHVRSTEVNQQAGLQRTAMQHEHLAGLEVLRQTAAHERSDATLSSQEAEAQAQRAHEAALAAPPPLK